MNVRFLGEPLPYEDGAEDELTQIFRTASDRTTGSAELESHIHDWPSRYHLSGRRANLLRALDVRTGDRVLDVGAGTGLLSRYLVEQGATVVALEGNGARAHAAAARLDGLDRCEVVCGDFYEFSDDDGFDLVTLVGVVEYSGDAFGGAHGPLRLLAKATSLLRPGGSVLVAIENQLGITYVLGGPEDHHGVPSVGIEGYRNPRPIRTWSRANLSSLLDEAGLTTQDWWYPFPDYKLPTAVLAHEVVARPEAGVVTRLVGDPTPVQADHVAPSSHPVRSLETFAAAGLGPEVANSFLVLASPDAAARRWFADQTVGWFEPEGVNAGPAGWHRLDPDLRTEAYDPLVTERTLFDAVRDAVDTEDGARLRELLGSWAVWVDGQTGDDGTVPGGSAGLTADRLVLGADDQLTPVAVPVDGPAMSRATYTAHVLRNLALDLEASGTLVGDGTSDLVALLTEHAGAAARTDWPDDLDEVEERWGAVTGRTVAPLTTAVVPVAPATDDPPVEPAPAPAPPAPARRSFWSRLRS